MESNLLDLKAEMVRNRVRQREVAALLGICESRLSDILNGFRAVDSGTRRAISEIVRQIIEQRKPEVSQQIRRSA